MANAYKDENGVSTKIGTLNSDGATIVRWRINPANGALKVDDNTTGTCISIARALKDQNDVSTALGVSSVDGFTPVPVYLNSSGEVLINSN